MNAVEAALEDIYSALAGVDGVRPTRFGMRIDPPATVVNPPKLLRQLLGPDPTEAEFQVAVVVAQTEHAMAELLRLEPLVAAALHSLRRAAVGVSEPGTWPAGDVKLPAYLIELAYPL